MHPIEAVLKNNPTEQKGIYSVCTSNSLVLQSAIRHAKKHQYILAIEATSNQVNQFGGYTGMQPADYARFVNQVIEQEGIDKDQVILGGDHLGPLTWQDLPEDQAMANAETLVFAYTIAGFTKIHLDTSMRLASDNPSEPLDVRICAKRCARLARCVYQAYEQRLTVLPDAIKPILIVGSEVPIPGGSQIHEDFVTPTDPQDFRNQHRVFSEEFAREGLSFHNVKAFVVQPGVEFGDDFVCQYNRKHAETLVQALPDYFPLVFEGHSTDYQSQESLSFMVDDGIRILKVGPALTFGLREALFLAEEIETIIVSDQSNRSNLKKFWLQEMDASDKYWKKYYSGSIREISYKKLYSYSDRCRYYLPAKRVQDAIDKLLFNLDNIPVALISQYFPRQFTKVLENNLSTDAVSIILDRIGNWCDPYAIACGIKLN